MNLDLKSLLISIFVAFVPLQITLIGQIFKKKKAVFCCTCCILGLLTILAPRVSGSPLLVCFSFPSADSLLTDPPAEGRGRRCLLN